MYIYVFIYLFPQTNFQFLPWEMISSQWLFATRFSEREHRVPILLKRRNTLQTM